MHTEKETRPPVMWMQHSASALSSLFDWFQSAADSVEWKERLIKGQLQSIFPIWRRAPRGLEVLAVFAVVSGPSLHLPQNRRERQILWLGIICYWVLQTGNVVDGISQTQKNEHCAMYMYAELAELFCGGSWLVLKADSTERSVVLQTKCIYPSLRH